MDRDEHLERKFAELFAGRTDVVGTDFGGCLHVEDTDSQWRNLYREHLNYTGHGIGVYPVMPTNEVWWGCVDIDTGNKPGALYETWEDAWQHALLLQRVLAQLSIEAWIEITRSEGAHVWVFACEPVRAAAMRRALIAAHQIADLPHKEINPKQEKLAEGKVGNYVRLPYPYGAENQYIIDLDSDPAWEDVPEAMTWAEFVIAAYETRMPASTFEQAAELYRAQPAVASTPSSYDPARIKNRSAYAAALIVNGPKGTDRSAYLWMVARTLCEADVPFRDAWDALCEADRRWGKFHERDQVEHLYRLLEKAYT